MAVALQHQLSELLPGLCRWHQNCEPCHLGFDLPPGAPYDTERCEYVCQPYSEAWHKALRPYLRRVLEFIIRYVEQRFPIMVAGFSARAVKQLSLTATIRDDSTPPGPDFEFKLTYNQNTPRPRFDGPRLCNVGKRARITLTLYLVLYGRHELPDRLGIHHDRRDPCVMPSSSLFRRTALRYISDETYAIYQHQASTVTLFSRFFPSRNVHERYTWPPEDIDLWHLRFDADAHRRVANIEGLPGVDLDTSSVVERPEDIESERWENTTPTPSTSETDD